jgi:Spy/CpxP family protein refolding chaperone
MRLVLEALVLRTFLEDPVMRSACRAMVALGLAALQAGPALAQPGGGARLARPTYWGNTVLQNKSVQEELKLTADQIDKIREISHSV